MKRNTHSNVHIAELMLQQSPEQFRYLRKMKKMEKLKRAEKDPTIFFFCLFLPVGL